LDLFVIISFCIHNFLFLPRDAMQAWPMRCQSVTFVHSVKMNKHIFKILSPLGSQAILVFSHQTAWQYSDGNTPKGGVECWWCRQKSRFWTYIWLNCLLLILQLARWCLHSRWWTTATVPQVECDTSRRCWLREKTTKCLWREASTLRQRQQNS